MFLSWILGITEWMPFDASPVDCFLQGLIGACGISVLVDLLRIHLFVQTCSNDGNEKTKQGTPLSAGKAVAVGWSRTVQFWCVAGLLSLVGSTVSSLVVLEFSLRTIATWVSAGLEGTPPSHSQLFLVQCQFSLGCALTCTLHFLQQGAPHSALSLLLAAGLSWALADFCHRLWAHVVTVYPLHSAERYCGKCMTLHASASGVLAELRKAVILAFGVASGACVATVCQRFLSQGEALKFWTPLTLCYTMLVVYVQDHQHRHPGSETVAHSVVLRLGALLVLLLTVGHWSDVLHLLITGLGEAVCLLPSQDILTALTQGVPANRNGTRAQEDTQSRENGATIPAGSTERDD